MHDPVPDSSVAEEFYGGALDRIRWFMVVLMGVFAALSWVRFGAATVLGFVIGCAIAFLNFFWLKKVINAFVERATSPAPGAASSGTVTRFLFRYFLMAVVAYAIFRFLPASLYGLLAGLFLPVGGILCEAGYEVFVALTRGF